MYILYTYNVYIKAFSLSSPYFKECFLKGRDFPGGSVVDSSIHGIFQIKIMEWVVISSSKGSSQPRGQTQVSCVSCIARQILYHCVT